MPWLSLTLCVDAAGAEVLSEALLEAGAQSVALDQELPGAPALSALLALDADPQAVVTQAARAAGLSAPPPFAVARLEDEDWVRKTQAQFSPIRIDARLWIVPSWHEPPEEAKAPGTALVRLDPGLAFGTGSHASTRLALGFLSRSVRGAERVLDYGCGSGILAIAAAKLGASRVDAVDLDPASIETTAANAASNGVSVHACPPEALEPCLYDLVVANILAQPLILLAPLLAGRTKPGGRIALSGILDAQAAEVAAAYSGSFEVRVGPGDGGWSLVEGTRR